MKAAVGAEPNVWSISVVDQRGRLLADHNGNVPRVPASNQKLIATAFALDRLGPDFRLKTQLLRHGDGSLEMVGEGDPDLTVSEIQRFAMVALGQGGSRTPSTLNQSGQIKLLVREEPRRNWWPSDWDPIDRSYAYGAPITRLALTSNALHMAVMDLQRACRRSWIPRLDARVVPYKPLLSLQLRLLLPKARGPQIRPWSCIARAPLPCMRC